MRASSLCSIRPAAVAVCVLSVLLLTVPALSADEPGIEVNEPSWIGKTLEHHMGKRVKLKLRSGQEVEGIVVKVGTHAVHVAQLAGMEFFDAGVRLDDVSAVVVRTRNK